ALDVGFLPAERQRDGGERDRRGGRGGGGSDPGSSVAAPPAQRHDQQAGPEAEPAASREGPGPPKERRREKGQREPAPPPIEGGGEKQRSEKGKETAERIGVHDQKIVSRLLVQLEDGRMESDLENDRSHGERAEPVQQPPRGERSRGEGARAD